jgi:hypothetical protein
MAKRSKSEAVPKHMQTIFDDITGLTDDFCKRFLNDEYRQLARQLTAALSRKRPSRLVSGNINTWACAVVYALGSVNFLFDRSNSPHMTADELCDHFGIAKSTGAAKSKLVRDEMKMYQMDPNWYLPSKMEQNPRAWQVMVNGYIVDIRSMPIEVQEIAYEKGLIPYIPASDC